MKTISIHKLKRGQLFKNNTRQRKFREFSKLEPLGNNVPEQFKGKFLLITADCRQLVVDSNYTVFVKTKSL